AIPAPLARRASEGPRWRVGLTSQSLARLTFFMTTLSGAVAGFLADAVVGFLTTLVAGFFTTLVAGFFTTLVAGFLVTAVAGFLRTPVAGFTVRVVIGRADFTARFPFLTGRSSSSS